MNALRAKPTYGKRTCSCGCGTEYEAVKPNQRYCRASHRNRAFQVAHPRQKVGVHTRMILGGRKYRLIDEGPV
jgi:hypothetical protein